MVSALDIVSRAQATSLMGPYEPPSREEHLSPYVSLGDMASPYDMRETGAVLEIKHALHALGQLAADKFRTADPAIETRWREIVLGEPSWDAATADEFAIAVGRYRGAGLQVAGPYAVNTAGGPQPTATGLELLAGAVNELLGGSPRMLNYERWRGGAFAPPSMLSGPSAETPIIHVDYFGPYFRLPPPDTVPALMEQIIAADRMVTDAQLDAMFNRPAATEEVRARLAADMILGRSIRDAWIEEAHAQSEVTGETRELTVPEAEAACIDLGGSWDGSRCVTPEKTGAEASTRPSASGAALIALGVAGLVGLVASRWRKRAPTPSYGRLTGTLAGGR